MSFSKSMGDKSMFTTSVHAGDNRSEHFGALSIPIYLASVYAFSDADEGAAIHNEEKDGSATQRNEHSRRRSSILKTANLP